ncbi:MAG TPA: serine hydrolase domain-containing protein [Gaiellaceae bacterium]|nr:serine hydrolase domain-containing protein [Gaiellaceae bacterium]
MDLTPYGAITSVVVERGGAITDELYADGDAESLRNTRSCTKTVLSLLAGIAGLDPSARVDELYPRASGTVAGEASVRELLTMSSRLDADDWDDSSPGNEELMYPSDDWVQFALSLPARAEAGFSYCTAGVVLLGAAVEHALGEPLTAHAQRELFTPLGIDRFEWPRAPRGETSCAGGLELRSRDLLALGRLALPGREGPVPGAWIRESTSAHARIDARTEYGYLWWIREFAGHRSVFMTGMGGSRVHVFPELDLVAVITSANFGVQGAHDLSDRLLVEQIL